MQNSEQSSSAAAGHRAGLQAAADLARPSEDAGLFWIACALVGAFITIAVTFVAATGLGAAAG